MNCDAGATNALSHPMMINATLFADNYINVATNRFLLYPILSLLFTCVLTILHKRICYVMLVSLRFGWHGGIECKCLVFGYKAALCGIADHCRPESHRIHADIVMCNLLHIKCSTVQKYWETFSGVISSKTGRFGRNVAEG